MASVVLTPKLPSKPTQLHQNPKPEPTSSNNGWGFFDVLKNPTSNDHAVKNEQVYIHPMVKRSASALSTKSLEMCTESLGTETGSDVSESSDEFHWDEIQRSKVQNFDRKMVTNRRRGGGVAGGFPPPLTSISGSDGTVKVRPHREGGRLVIKAVSVSDCGTKFVAQRTNGRLSLTLLGDCCVNVESGRGKIKNEEENCDGQVEEGGDGGWREMDGDGRSVVKTKVRSPKRKSRFPNSSEKSTEFALTKCKGGGNGNKGVGGNWSLLRVVIS